MDKETGHIWSPFHHLPSWMRRKLITNSLWRTKPKKELKYLLGQWFSVTVQIFTQERRGGKRRREREREKKNKKNSAYYLPCSKRNRVLSSFSRSLRTSTRICLACDIFTLPNAEMPPWNSAECWRGKQHHVVKHIEKVYFKMIGTHWGCLTVSLWAAWSKDRRCMLQVAFYTLPVTTSFVYILVNGFK